MITSFEVGAVFRIVNEASPALTKILRQVREITKAAETARLALTEITKGIGSGAGLAASIGEADKLAASWKNVAKSAADARLAMTGGAVRPAGNIFRPGVRSGAGGGGGGAHVGGPSVGMPGGGHVSFRGGAAAAAGLLGYGVYEAAEMEDAVFQLNYHSGRDQSVANRSMFRKVIQDAMASSGYGLRDIAEAAKQEIRMFQGTPGGGIDVLPEMLRAATIESRLKGESPMESMKALIGLAHMTKEYSPDAIKRLAPAFAFLSTANPGSLGSIEKAAGYAVPLLQSGLDIDPTQTLLLGIALTRAGATSTKSGTWLREMALRSMPGTSLMSRIAYKRHEEALRAMGLVDNNDKPTWFTGGKPDLPKMLQIAGDHAAAIPLEKRASYERQLFGAQGAGGFALLSDPAVMGQVRALRGQMESPEFKARYGGFMAEYNQSVTAQNARTSVQTFNNLMMDIGQKVLPSVNYGLGDLKGALEGVRKLLPHGTGVGALVGARAMEFGVAGSIGGFAIAGPPGAAIGALGGGVLGTAEGFMESYSKANGATQDKAENEAFIRALRAAGTTGRAPGPVQVQSQTNINLDGSKIAEAVVKYLAQVGQFSSQAPMGNGLDGYNYGGD